LATTRSYPTVEAENSHALITEESSRQEGERAISLIPNRLPTVAILLASFHGKDFLSLQLDSIVDQSFKDWRLWISDDGSEDGTLDLAARYSDQLEKDRISIVNGPRQGFVKNFLSLICDSDIEAKYFALCDQDDIWKEDKLVKAVKWLDGISDDTPAVYCSRTQLIDDNDKIIGFSPTYCRPPTFRNALVQNIAGGNTMVFNKAARQLLIKAGKEIDVVFHDWWIYLLVAGSGGTVFYSREPSVLYRQHKSNQIGSSNGIFSKVFRIHLLLNGQFRQWMTTNTSALEKVSGILTPENRKILREFQVSRNQSLFIRMYGLWKTGVYRQTLAGNFALAAACILKKV